MFLLQAFEAAAAALCVLAIGADVASAHFDYVSIEGSELVFQRFPGASTNDQLTITYKSDATGTYFAISDPTSTGITNFPPCASTSRGDLSVRCPASRIALLVVNTRSGNNAITINAPTAAKLYGGSGSDTVRGGSGPTQLFGQGGADTLFAGHGGGNVLLGGTGSNKLMSKNGFQDTVYYCPGTDTVTADSFDRLMFYCPRFDEPDPFDTGNPVVVGLTGKRRQRVLVQGKLVLRASATKPGGLRATATVSLPGSKTTLSLRRAAVPVPFAGVPVPFELKVPRRIRTALGRALAANRTLRAKVLVTAVSSFGKRSATIERDVRLTS